MEPCAECVRLWRAYAKATADHVGLQNKLREVAVTQLWESADLTLAVAAAVRLREQARDAIRTHEEVAHAGKTRAASA